MLDCFFMCSETWRGFICGNPVRPRVDITSPRTVLVLFLPGIQESSITFYINFLTQGLQDKICNVHLNPEPVWKADLQLYILRRDFPCLLVKIQAESDKLPYYLSVLLGTLFFLFHLFTQTIALWGFWPYSVCIRRYGRSRPHLLVLIWV